MKKLFCVLLVFAMAIPAFAEIKITGSAPTIKGGYGTQYDDEIIEKFNSETQKTFEKALAELNNQLQFLVDPDNFLQAMGNSSVYASHGATTRAYGGYKKFSITLGSMVGFQIPSDISSIKNDIDKLPENLKKDGDVNLGASPNMINLNVGLNMGMIKLDKLYLGLRVGYFGLPEIALSDNLTLNNYKDFTLGATVNYQIIPSFSLAGLIVWRGLSIGSGLIYNRSDVGFTIFVDDITQQIPRSSLPYDTSIVLADPKAKINLNSQTYTIPLEAITSIKLIIFNIPLGIGVDLAFGSTSLGANPSADIKIEGLENPYSMDKNGDISIEGSLSNTPSFFNFKIMTGFGFSMGPVVIDIPVTFYPVNHGYNFGFTIGAVY